MPRAFNIPKALGKLDRGEALKVVVAGNSIVAKSGASWPTEAWDALVQSQIAARYPNTALTWTNSGVGGTTSTYLKDNWAAKVATFAPDLVVIAEQTNDGNLVTQSVIEANYDYFLAQCNALGAELLVVLESTYAFQVAPYGSSGADPNLALRKTKMEAMRDWCKRNGVGYVDHDAARRRWLTDRGLPETSSLLHYDHIHPNDIGHRLIAQEVMYAFTSRLDETRELDRRYGGRNWALYGQSATLRDVTHQNLRRQGYSRYDVRNQLVDLGGMWSIKDYVSAGFKKAKLFGTRATTGTETVQPLYTPDWTIIPNANDFIEVELKDARRVWFQLDGDSATPTEFKVYVDGVLTQTLAVSNASSVPVEVATSADGVNKHFLRGTRKVRIERTGTIPAGNPVVFHGFLAQHYRDDEADRYTQTTALGQAVAPVYSTLDAAITSYQGASGAGVMAAPIPWQAVGGAGVQLSSAAAAFGEFYGDTLTLDFTRAASGNHNVLIYVDGTLKETVNLTGGGTVSQQYTALGAGRKHKFEVVTLNGQVNLKRVRFSDTLV